MEMVFFGPSKFPELTKWKVGVLPLLHTDKFVLILKSKREAPYTLISELLQSACSALAWQSMNGLAFLDAMANVRNLNSFSGADRS